MVWDSNLRNSLILAIILIYRQRQHAFSRAAKEPRGSGRRVDTDQIEIRGGWSGGARSSARCRQCGHVIVDSSCIGIRSAGRELYCDRPGNRKDAFQPVAETGDCFAVISQFAIWQVPKV